jgi:hypothetical protein
LQETIALALGHFARTVNVRKPARKSCGFGALRAASSCLVGSFLRGYRTFSEATGLVAAGAAERPTAWRFTIQGYHGSCDRSKKSFGIILLFDKEGKRSQQKILAFGYGLARGLHVLFFLNV